MAPTVEKKGLLGSLKAAFSSKKKGEKSTMHGEEAISVESEPSIAAAPAASSKSNKLRSANSNEVVMTVPQGKAGKGFISAEVFGDDGRSSEDKPAAAATSGMLNISEAHLKSFDQHDGLLMISPFLPEGLQECQWKMSEFVIVETLYSTKSSKVFHIEHQKSQTQIALKCYNKASMIDLQKIQAMREIWFHSRLTHPSVISMYAAWVEKGKICLAIEYAPIGSAFRKLRKVGSFPEPVSAKYIVFKILCALQFLHDIGLIHRDIKPENILLTVDGCKLADLGLVINHKQEAANTCLGTFDYMAPELFQLPRKSHPMQFKDDPNVKTCDEKVDVWAMGVLMYELVYGKAPFAASSSKGPMETVNLIMKGFNGSFPPLPRTSGEELSAEGKDFILKALAQNPADRPSVKELLKHPWITKHCRQPAEVAAKLAEMSLSKIQGKNDGWISLAMGGTS